MSWRAAALVLACAAVAACAREPLPAPDVAARVDDRQIPYAEFEGYLKRNSVELESALGSDVLSRLFDQFLQEELFRKMAVDRGLVPADAGGRQAAAALMASAEAEALDEERIAEYYRTHQDEFELPERVRLRQILVEDREKAEGARAQIAAGAPFAEVARRLSEEPSAARGGDQGVLSREDLPPAFADGIFALAPGESSDIIRADYGYHIFQVTERRPAELVSLAAAAPEIRERLARERSQSTVAQLAAEARERYDVEVYRRNLPFNYQGSYESPSA